jgi:replicative DNA helicase
MYLCGDYIPTHNTDIAIEYILRQIVQNKANVVLFSLEMPRGKIMERIVCKILKKRISEVKELIIQGDTLVNQVLDKIGKKLYIVDENNLSMHDIERYINTINTRNIMEGGVDVIVVDYFTYLKGAGDYEGASEQALMMKGIAKRYNVIFTMLSQLNRSGNTYEEPTMNQLRMTGDLEASADYILMIWRPDKAPNLSLEKQQELRNVTRCKVEKARDGMNGPPMFELKYDVHTSRLEEVLTTDN